MAIQWSSLTAPGICQSQDQLFPANPPRHRRRLVWSGRAIHCKDKATQADEGHSARHTAKCRAIREGRSRLTHRVPPSIESAAFSYRAPRPHGTHPYHHPVPGFLPAKTSELQRSPVLFQLPVVTRRNSRGGPNPFSICPKPASGSSVAHTSRLMNEGGHTKEGPHQIVRMGPLFLQGWGWVGSSPWKRLECRRLRPPSRPLLQHQPPENENENGTGQSG
jgi:hypothetical protein